MIEARQPLAASIRVDDVCRRRGGANPSAPHEALFPVTRRRSRAKDYHPPPGAAHLAARGWARRAGRLAGEMFANLFPKRDRFTPANLRRLADALTRTPAVTPANGDHLVETFREIAELMIYGDQNDPSFFDLFVELKVMSHISRFVKQSGSRRGSSKLTLQLLQTLSIMIQNTREETSLFYLFSNDHVPKELIEHDFDFDDEEVLAYYISFLKTVSLKLNPRTIQFFFFTGADNGTRRSRREPESPDASASAASADADDDANASFPLYERATRFLAHPESMVRAAARAAVLNCAGTPDARVRRWLLSPRAWSACAPRVVAHAGATTAALTDATLGAAGDGPGASERSNLVAELVDLLHYVDDLASVPDPNERTGGGGFATRAEEELWSGLVEPTLLRSIAATDADEGSSGTDAAARAGKDANVSGASPPRDAGPPVVSLATALFALSRLFASSTRRSVLARASAALLRPTDATGRPNPRRLAVVRALRGDREDLAAAATAALTALVKSRHADDDELRAAGLSAATEGDEAETNDAREEMADALVEVLTRREPGAPAETRMCAAFLLRRVEGTRDDERDGENRTSAAGRRQERRLAALDEAVARDAASIVDEMDGPWSDVAGPLLAAEWTRARRGAERPTTHEDAVVGAIREAAASAAGGARWGKNDASAAAGVRLIRAARAFALAAMLRDARRSGAPTPTDFPDSFLGDAAATAAALGYPPPLRVRAHGDLEVREGTEVLVPGAEERGPDGHPARSPCRVAFEAGRERRVFLVVASRVKGACVSSSAVLVEPIEGSSSRGTVGVVRAVAPLAGCRAEMDASHRKWLHVRVRSPQSCLLAVADADPADAATARRRLRRGHWTLAFSDEATCAAAKAMVDARAATLRNACRVVVAPIAEAAAKSNGGKTRGGKTGDGAPAPTTR